MAKTGSKTGRRVGRGRDGTVKWKIPPSSFHCQTLDMFVVHNVNISIGTWPQTSGNFTLAIVREHLLQKYAKGTIWYKKWTVC